MSDYLIKQGRHYHQVPPLWSLPWIGEQSMARTVTFDASCEYDSAAYNADDVNKLFGLSFGFGGVHHNSARFGWRWSKSAQCIELLAYCYTDGKRNQDEQLRFPVVAQVKLGQSVRCSLAKLATGAFGFTVRQVDNGNILGVDIFATNESLPSYGLTHGPYWGGETLCPHDMRISLLR